MERTSNELSLLTFPHIWKREGEKKEDQTHANELRGKQCTQ